MVLVSAFLLLLSWTREFVQLFIQDEETARSATIATAVLSICGIDFAVNAVQGSCRGLIVDTLPEAKQQMGSSWASRMVAVGSLVGYGAGAVDLGAIFGPTLGDTQFKQLTAVAAITLCLVVGLTSYCVTERVLVSSGKEDEGEAGALEMIKTIAHNATHLPRSISAICFVQFWAWIGE